MNIENIKGIMESSVWKRITNHKEYRGNIILDSERTPSKQRTEGQFFILLIFFGHNINNKTILKYQQKCCSVPKRCGHEMLDTPPIYEFYGRMKMLRIS